MKSNERIIKLNIQRKSAIRIEHSHIPELNTTIASHQAQKKTIKKQTRHKKKSRTTLNKPAKSFVLSAHSHAAVCQLAYRIFARNINWLAVAVWQTAVLQTAAMSSVYTDASAKSGCTAICPTTSGTSASSYGATTTTASSTSRSIQRTSFGPCCLPCIFQRIKYVAEGSH